MVLPLIFAHRGASGYEYENTMKSFTKAIDMGADGLETDCWLLSDGTVAIHHDKAIRIPGQEKMGNISNMTLDEIKKIQLPNGESIPTLKEFFDKFAHVKTKKGNPLYFSIDIQDTKVSTAMIQIIKDFDVLDQVYLCGNTTMVLKKARSESPKIKLVASNLEMNLIPKNFEKDSKFTTFKLNVFNIQMKNFKPTFQDFLHKYGLLCFIWDLHSEADLRKYLAYKPDAVYSNYPDLAIKIREDVCK
jgi:glycerophosphoryl diester phosphodiesterase